MTKIRIAAFDGSLRNFGIAKLDYDLDTDKLEVVDLILTQTSPSKVKTVRSSSDNLARAQALAVAARESLADCAMVFGEVPSGGQDYKAVLGFGIVIGIYASVVTPFVEVSPGETKLAAVGTRTASKEEMIEWAVENFPNAPWRRQEKNGAKFKKGDLKSDNEHLADAVAIAAAGIKLPVFKQTLAMLRATKLAA